MMMKPYDLWLSVFLMRIKRGYKPHEAAQDANAAVTLYQERLSEGALDNWERGEQ